MIRLALVCLIVATVPLAASCESNPKWEYKCIDERPMSDETELGKEYHKKFNKLGDDGWEMITASMDGVCFKRRK
ncbi:MAG: hypothetical protein RBU30_16030 [Polyangia bacterium]|jgi:hypothetical protein|nr:hypothetical protein [Polyangia bacterium]